jgi:hypothetical protein
MFLEILMDTCEKIKDRWNLISNAQVVFEGFYWL